MSEIQRRIVRRLRAYLPGDLADGHSLAVFLGVKVGTIRYHAKKLQMRGIVKGVMGSGYTLTVEGRGQTRWL